MYAQLSIDHIAIVCCNRARSVKFYTKVLGFCVESEEFRIDEQSYKIDLVGHGMRIEMYTYSQTVQRPINPEILLGVRHIALSVDNLIAYVAYLRSQDIAVEQTRVDVERGRRYTFFTDPDGLPIELCERV